MIQLLKSIRISDFYKVLQKFIYIEQIVSFSCFVPLSTLEIGLYMRIDAINALNVGKIGKIHTIRGNYKNSNSNFRVVSLSEYKSSPLSFTGKNKSQAIFIGAESDPYSKAGGVGTVMKDYRAIPNSVQVIPYYGAKYNKNKVLEPLVDKDGDYILKTTGGEIKLDLVSKKQMQWGKDKNQDIMLFSIKNDPKKDTYFVFNEMTAVMPKPYSNGFVYSSGAKANNNGWQGDAYAQFSKAGVEFLPDIIKDKPDFDPATIVCSDSQTAYVAEYLAKKSVNDDDEAYKDINPTYVGHNMGPGYCGETSKQNMFVNLGATPKQIEMIENDPLYYEKGDDYFTPFVKKVIDETGTASAVMIPIYYSDHGAKNNGGYLKAFSVVAEEYAKSLVENPQAAHNIHNHLVEMDKKGALDGILNPLEDSSVDSAKPLLNERYNEDCVDTDGKIYPKFDVYPSDLTYKKMREIKNSNKLKLLERFSAKDNTIITGNPKRTAKINPEIPDAASQPLIRKDLIDLVKSGHGDDVPLFVSWGRIDTQKGHDITLDAFEKFAKTPEGKNAILILGAGLDGGNESKKVEAKISKMLSDPELKGRLIHIDGWAPAYALASAADAAIFASRFEPCGLTDLEAMKYYCTPVVTNTQGLKQKNFDPRNPEEKDKATSYKTKHEYNLTKDKVELIIDTITNNKDTDSLSKEFPIFNILDSNGNKIGYDTSVFNEFVQDYQKYKSAKLDEYKYKNENPPKNWDDWDELSKDYSFKFDGPSRKLKDSILSYELSDAVSACVSADESTKETIFNNLHKLDTTWQHNNMLHPSGKSSLDLYKEIHMYKSGNQPDKSQLISLSDDEVESQITKNQKDDLIKKSAGYSLSAIMGAVGAMAAIAKSKFKHEFGEAPDEMLEKLNNVTAKNEELHSELVKYKNQVEELSFKLQEKCASKKLRAVLIALTSAAIGVLCTYFYITHKQKKETNNNPFSLVKPKLTNNQNESPKLNNNTLSLNDFKNKLS